MNPNFPVYIVSKGRWKSRLTVKALDARRVPFCVVVEPQEEKNYSDVVGRERVLVLPFENLGQGSIPARNWIWEHSIKCGYKSHWILDDNIRDFYRVDNSLKIRTRDGSTFRAIEDFVNRYENVALAGMQYEMFLTSKMTVAPFLLNTRIYSCILVRNDIPFRWRGRYNEDTDLSIRALKEGFVTVLFWAFLAKKIATMRMSGGNTEELYKLDNADGRLLMAQSLQKQHPDVVKITRKWGRWQHQVNYKPFKNNRLIKKEGIVIPHGVNNYGMKLVKVNDGSPD